MHVKEKCVHFVLSKRIFYFHLKPFFSMIASKGSEKIALTCSGWEKMRRKSMGELRLH